MIKIRKILKVIDKILQEITKNYQKNFYTLLSFIADTFQENIKAPFKWVAIKFSAETEVSKRELKVPYVASASDGFTAENLAYYKALFNGMNTVYIHLQNLLFVVVGGFFLATLGGGKI